MCMAGPPSGTPLQAEHGAAVGDGGRLLPDHSSINYRSRPIDGGNISGSSSTVVLRQDVSIDPDLDYLLSELQNDVDQQDFAACFSTTSSTSAHSVCNAQPRVYKRFPSLTRTYCLPPFANCEVVQLQCLPPDPARHADLASHVNCMPPHQPSPTPPAYSNFNTHQFGAEYHQDPQFSYSKIGLPNPNYDPENSFSFGFGFPGEFPSLHIHGEASAVGATSLRNNLSASTMEIEINHKNIYCHQDPQFFSLHSPNYNMYSDQQNFKKSAGLSGLHICASPTSCPSNGATFPAYMQSSYRTRAAASDPAAMEVSRMSTPTSTSPFYQTNSNMLSERKSVSVSSPTPSVSKEMRSSTAHDGDQVAFRVKTEILNLHDGFTWKKYGEKTIKKMKHVRSYFRCDENDRSGCKVLKRTQRCSPDEDYVTFTYLGRHTHHP